MSPRLALLWAAALVLSAFPASAQSVSFSTTTYASDNLWFPNGGPNSELRVDLNGDGREDFISDNTASWTSGCTGSFAVALSTGDGAYASPVCYTLPAGVALYFATGDFYGIGTMDVAVTNEQGNVYVYKNGAGSGALTLTDSITLDSEASGIVAADVNHDGHIDLVYDVGNANTGGGGTLHVLLGNGDGTFTVGPTITFIMNNQPAGSLAVGDFDGDGIGDIMVIGGALADAEVLYGDNAGNFTPGPVLGGLDSGGQ